MKNIMNILVISFFSFVIITLTNHDSFARTNVRWYSFNKGMQLAKKYKKPVVIDFYADWCKWCKVMDRQTFSDHEVAGKLRKSYVAIRIDMQKDKGLLFYKDKKMTAKEFAGYMGVQGLPTLVFLDKKGNPVTKIPGFVKKEVFLPLLNYMEEECYTKNIAFKDYMSGKALCKGKGGR